MDHVYDKPDDKARTGKYSSKSGQTTSSGASKRALSPNDRGSLGSSPPLKQHRSNQEKDSSGVAAKRKADTKSTTTKTAPATANSTAGASSGRKKSRSRESGVAHSTGDAGTTSAKTGEKTEEHDESAAVLLDDSQTAKREYNRVCAAKSRDRRKRTLSSLNENVQAAAKLFESLMEQNRSLRENVDSLFQETMNELLQTQVLGNTEQMQQPQVNFNQRPQDQVGFNFSHRSSSLSS